MVSLVLTTSEGNQFGSWKWGTTCQTGETPDLKAESCLPLWTCYPCHQFSVLVLSWISQECQINKAPTLQNLSMRWLCRVWTIRFTTAFLCIDGMPLLGASWCVRYGLFFKGSPKCNSEFLYWKDGLEISSNSDFFWSLWAYLLGLRLEEES